MVQEDSQLQRLCSLPLNPKLKKKKKLQKTKWRQILGTNELENNHPGEMPRGGGGAEALEKF